MSVNVQKAVLIVLVLVEIMASHMTLALSQPRPANPQCEQWAQQGECVSNAAWMWPNCLADCHREQCNCPVSTPSVPQGWMAVAGCLRGHNDQIFGTSSMYECAQQCSVGLGAACKSVEYDAALGQCVLSRQSPQTRPYDTYLPCYTGKDIWMGVSFMPAAAAGVTAAATDAKLARS